MFLSLQLSFSFSFLCWLKHFYLQKKGHDLTNSLKKYVGKSVIVGSISPYSLPKLMNGTGFAPFPSRLAANRTQLSKYKETLFTTTFNAFFFTFSRIS